ncbi:septation protein SepH [Sciscionella marina]|uniref:septation protein SepH n=1 Tax=Sciscionella marina TaxID=508770 RepID=UPI00036CF2B6|nr:septation protein SepH [Sciscionella marina]
MRSLRIVGLDESGTFVLCEDSHGERFKIPADAQLRAAARGDVTRLGQIEIELEHNMRPREIQARIRAGESVEHVAHVACLPMQRVERFAYPVLLERSRTTELAQQAHPVREDGPDVQTLSEVAACAFGHWGQDFDSASWDSWRGDDGRWVVQLSWKAGRSENRAHWAFSPGAHGGTVVPLDERAEHVLDPQSRRGLRTVGSSRPARDTEPEFLVTNTSDDTEGFEEADTLVRGELEPIPAGDPILSPPVELVAPEPEPEPEPEPAAPEPEPETEPVKQQAAAPKPKNKGKGKPAVPAWEDVLLGVRSNR